MSPSSMRRINRLQKSPALHRQRGNAVVFALLGLAITGLMVNSTIEQKRIEQKNALGSGEATVLVTLSNGANKAIYENFTSLRSGLPLTKAGVTVNPVVVAGQPVWRPTIPNLRDMGYLPPGWNTTSSLLNDGNYAVEFRRVCLGTTCDIDGYIVNGAPVRADNQAGTVDGAMVGPVLERIGADAGVSLMGSSGNVTGFGNTWTLPNPVAGNPPGVLAVRVGSLAGSFADFLRVGDARDPNFSGNMTVAGNTTLNGTLNVAQGTTLNNTLNVAGATALGNSLTVSGITTLNGATNINANAQVGAGAQVAFAGAANDCVTIAGTGIRLRCGNAGTPTGSNSLITGDGASFSQGAQSVSIAAASGSITTTGDVFSGGNVSGRRLVSTEVVSEGAACSAGQIAQLNTGGIAVCQNGRFRAPGRFASGGAACTSEGTTASDATSGVGLICKGGQWRQTASLMSPFQLRGSWMVANGSVVSKPACGSSGTTVGQPLVFILARNDTSTDAAFNRYAVDSGGSWTIALRNGDNSPANGAQAIAMAYCFFPGT